mmetsp:Transcript_39464/g.71513  ORF Transcript_39464/g.71513 Transcript_39464/m.71513 type:complete len:298 (+) Transcript_39464:25-918(+)
MFLRKVLTMMVRVAAPDPSRISWQKRNSWASRRLCWQTMKWRWKRATTRCETSQILSWSARCSRSTTESTPTSTYRLLQMMAGSPAAATSLCSYSTATASPWRVWVAVRGRTACTSGCFLVGVLQALWSRMPESCAFCTIPIAATPPSWRSTRRSATLATSGLAKTKCHSASEHETLRKLDLRLLRDSIGKKLSWVMKREFAHSSTEVIVYASTKPGMSCSILLPSALLTSQMRAKSDGVLRLSSYPPMVMKVMTTRRTIVKARMWPQSPVTRHGAVLSSMSSVANQHPKSSSPLAM